MPGAVLWHNWQWTLALNQNIGSLGEMQSSKNRISEGEPTTSPALDLDTVPWLQCRKVDQKQSRGLLNWGGEIQSLGLSKQPEWLAQCTVYAIACLGMTSLACASWEDVGLTEDNCYVTGNRRQNSGAGLEDVRDLTQTPPKMYKDWIPQVSMRAYSDAMLENGPVRTKLRNERT